MTGPPELPRREDDTPPHWWAPYKAEFPRWRAWRGTRQFWVRLPGTMRVYRADHPADLASQIRAATAHTFLSTQVPDYHPSTHTGDPDEHQ